MGKAGKKATLSGLAPVPDLKSSVVEKEVDEDAAVVQIQTELNGQLIRMQLGNTLKESLERDADAYARGQEFGEAFHRLLIQQGIWALGIGLETQEVALLNLLKTCKSGDVPREPYIHGLHSYYSNAYFHKLGDLLLKEKKRKEADREREGKEGSVSPSGSWASRCCEDE